MRHMYLTVLSQNGAACQVEWIALCFGPWAVELPLPLNAVLLQPWLGTHTRLFSRMAFNPPAVHLRLLLGVMPSSCPWLLLIQAASFKSNQLRIGWDLKSRYSSHAGADCTSPAHTIQTFGCPGGTSRLASLRRCMTMLSFTVK